MDQELLAQLGLDWSAYQSGLNAALAYTQTFVASATAAFSQVSVGTITVDTSSLQAASAAEEQLATDAQALLAAQEQLVSSASDLASAQSTATSAQQSSDAAVQQSTADYQSEVAALRQNTAELQNQVSALSDLTAQQQAQISSLQQQVTALKEHGKASQQAGEFTQLFTERLQELGLPIGTLQGQFGNMREGITGLQTAMGGGEEAAGALTAGMASLAVAGFAVAAAAATEATKSFIDLSDRVRETSEMTGVSEPTVQAFGLGLQELGLSADTGQRALEIFQRNVGTAADAIAAGTAPAKNFSTAMADLGINTEAFVKLNPDQRLAAIMDAFAAASPEVNKTQIAMDLLGRSGATLIPILNQGSGALDTLKSKIDSAGSSVEATQGTVLQFHAAMADLGNIVDGFDVKAGSILLPLVTQLIGGFQELGRAADNVGGVLGRLAGPVGLLGDAWAKLPGPLQDFLKYSNPITDALLAEKAGIDALAGSASAAAPPLAALSGTISTAAVGFDQFGNVIQRTAPIIDQFGNVIQRTSTLAGGLASAIQEKLVTGLATLKSHVEQANTSIQAGALFQAQYGQALQDVALVGDDWTKRQAALEVQTHNTDAAAATAAKSQLEFDHALLDLQAAGIDAANGLQIVDNAIAATSNIAKVLTGDIHTAIAALGQLVAAQNETATSQLNSQRAVFDDTQKLNDLTAKSDAATLAERSAGLAGYLQDNISINNEIAALTAQRATATGAIDKSVIDAQIAGDKQRLASNDEMIREIESGATDLASIATASGKATTAAANAATTAVKDQTSAQNDLNAAVQAGNTLATEAATLQKQVKAGTVDYTQSMVNGLHAATEAARTQAQAELSAAQSDQQAWLQVAQSIDTTTGLSTKYTETEVANAKARATASGDAAKDGVAQFTTALSAEQTAQQGLDSQIAASAQAQKTYAQAARQDVTSEASAVQALGDTYNTFSENAAAAQVTLGHAFDTVGQQMVESAHTAATNSQAAYAQATQQVLADERALTGDLSTEARKQLQAKLDADTQIQAGAQSTAANLKAIYDRDASAFEAAENKKVQAALTARNAEESAADAWAKVGQAVYTAYNDEISTAIAADASLISNTVSTQASIISAITSANQATVAAKHETNAQLAALDREQAALEVQIAQAEARLGDAKNAQIIADAKLKEAQDQATVQSAANAAQAQAAIAGKLAAQSATIASLTAQLMVALASQSDQAIVTSAQNRTRALGTAEVNTFSAAQISQSAVVQVQSNADNARVASGAQRTDDLTQLEDDFVQAATAAAKAAFSAYASAASAEGNASANLATQRVNDEDAWATAAQQAANAVIEANNQANGSNQALVAVTGANVTDLLGQIAAASVAIDTHIGDTSVQVSQDIQDVAHAAADAVNRATLDVGNLQNALANLQAERALIDTTAAAAGAGAAAVNMASKVNSSLTSIASTAATTGQSLQTNIVSPLQQLNDMFSTPTPDELALTQQLDQLTIQTDQYAAAGQAVPATLTAQKNALQAQLQLLQDERKSLNDNVTAQADLQAGTSKSISVLQSMVSELIALTAADKEAKDGTNGLATAYTNLATAATNANAAIAATGGGVSSGGGTGGGGGGYIRNPVGGFGSGYSAGGGAWSNTSGSGSGSGSVSGGFANITTPVSGPPAGLGGGSNASPVAVTVDLRGAVVPQNPAQLQTLIRQGVAAGLSDAVGRGGVLSGIRTQ